jgi:prophage antirepressor-like protein
MKELQNFAFNDRLVRTTTKDGEPRWIARDVCAILGLGNVTEALRNLDEDERDSVILNTPGGPQEMTVISEPGLYSLILRSRKPEARQFRRWITHEVIPAIRRTGAYSRVSEIQALIAQYEGRISKYALGKLVLMAAQEMQDPKPKQRESGSSDSASELVLRFLGLYFPVEQRPVKVPIRTLFEEFRRWIGKGDDCGISEKHKMGSVM